MPEVQCSGCPGRFMVETSRFNRAQKLGAPLYCCKVCAGLARRSGKTPEQRRTEKAEYDRQRREALGDTLRAEKRAFYEANRERILAQMTEYRKRRMPAHVEYCRRPEYVAWKREYDRQRRATLQYGEFADAFLLLQDIETEIDSHADRYEIGLQNGTINKAQTRRRALP